jgi:hypothetical protein
VPKCVKKYPIQNITLFQVDKIVHIKTEPENRSRKKNNLKIFYLVKE